MASEHQNLLDALEPAFEAGTGRRLSPDQVMFAFLALVRLKDIEDMAEKGDWEGIKAYTPIDPDNRT